MPTKEEIEKSVELAKKKWPSSFEGENDGRPHITAEDSEDLNRELRAQQAARTSGLPKPFRPKF